MKPTQVAELLANIRKTFVSFFSILMFVALGVGIFLGISWVAPALEAAAGGVYAQGAFHDVQVQYLYGLTDDDLVQLGEVEGVTDVEGARQSFQILDTDEGSLTVKVQTMGQRIDVPIVVEGELPAHDGEIALDAAAAGRCGLGIGDTLTFEPDGESDAASEEGAEPAGGGDGVDGDDGDDGAVGAVGEAGEMKYLTGATYRVSALVESPEFLATSPATYGSSNTPSGRVDLLAWVLPSAFDAGAFQGGYPVVNVSFGELAGLDAFSDKYAAASAQVEARVTDLGESLARARYADIHGQAQEKVDEAEAQLEEGKRQIAEGEQQLADGRAQLEQQRAEGEAMLAAAYQQLSYYEALRGEAEQARRLYGDGSGALAFVDDDEEVEFAGEAYSVGELRDLGAGATGAQDELETAYGEKSAELDAGWAQYYAGQAELDAQVAAGEQALADGEAQLDQAKAQVAEQEPKLEQAKAQLAAMKDYDWTVLPRSYNAGAAQVSMFGDITTNLSFSMAALFVIVGLLVSYSAVSRIVHEQVTQIGTKKALGLRGREITLSFLAYSGLAVVLGAVIGTAVGVTLVEGIIGHVLGKMFVFGDYAPYFGPTLFLAVTALELLLVLGATWLACRSVLREHAVELLKGEKPPAGRTRFYEKWGVWERLPLFTQTIVNNCVNDKRRVFSTVVGVAGCTALIVTAITLNDDVLASYDRHYEDVYGFNAIAYVDTSVAGAAGDVEESLRGQGARTAQVLRKTLVMTHPDGSRATVRLVVPADGDSLSEVYHVNPVSDGAFDLGSEGVWMSRAYADHLGAAVGDTVSVTDGDGAQHSLPILGFYEFWLTYQEMVMGADYYGREFGAELVPNVVLADTGGAGVEEVGEALADVEGFSSITDDKAAQGESFSQFSSISRSVVAIYMALSVLMAIVVLLNLNVMFIDEKKRELIVLMINGFSTGAAKRYIYNDTIVLTVLGIALGVAFGCVMGSVTVGAIEFSSATFVKDIDALAVGAGVVGSAVLAFIMSLVALRRIPRFDLTDINKF